MFRGRSNDKDNGSQRPGKGEAKGRQSKSTKQTKSAKQAKAARQARRKVDPRRAEQRAFDPRSGETGKKIRRIEAGPGPGRPADPTEIGGPPAQPVPGGLASRAPSLPPLKQPTGDIPRVPADAAFGDIPDLGDQTVSVPNGSSAGVFEQKRPTSMDAEAAPGRPLRAVTEFGDDAADRLRASTDAVGFDRSTADEGLDVARSEIDDRAADVKPGSLAGRDMSQIPSALPEFDDPPIDAVGPAVEDTPHHDLRSDTAADFGDFASVGAAAGLAGAGAAAMSGGDQFDAGDPRQSPAYAAASRGPQAPQMDGTRPMPRDLAGSGGFDNGRGGDGGRSRPQRRERPQDTEFKLADNRPRQKPKEPNRVLLFLALAAVLLAGAAAAWYLTQRDDGSADVAADGSELATTDSTEVDATADTVAPEAPAVEEPVVDVPTLFFDAATEGPLQQGETYSIDLVGEPEGSMLQVVVDDIPQGNPDPLLPDLILPSGRHTLYIQITNGAEITQSTPVELYVLGDPPPQGFRANLSSVDMVNEGWPEAIRQFDEYRAAGHEALQLMPLSPGYWNLFIGGLGEDRSAAQSYCESFGLAVPDECFPTYFEAPAGAADTTATTAAATTQTTVAESTSESTDAMTDEDTTSTTVAGG